MYFTKFGSEVEKLLYHFGSEWYFPNYKFRFGAAPSERKVRPSCVLLKRLPQG